MGFADIVRLHQQPTALDLDPADSRALFLRDINQTFARGGALHGRAMQQDRYDFDQALRAKSREPQYRFRNLTPRETRYRASAAQSTEPLLRAVLRDAAIQQYDVSTPGLREAHRAERS